MVKSSSRIPISFNERASLWSLRYTLFFRYMKHLSQTMNRFGRVCLCHLIPASSGRKTHWMKYFLSVYLCILKDPDNSSDNCRTSIPEKARVSDNRTERVKHAGKGGGHHQRYPLHDLRYKALPYLCPVPVTSG